MRRNQVLGMLRCCAEYLKREGNRWRRMSFRVEDKLTLPAPMTNQVAGMVSGIGCGRLENESGLKRMRG